MKRNFYKCPCALLGTALVVIMLAGTGAAQAQSIVVGGDVQDGVSPFAPGPQPNPWNVPDLIVGMFSDGTLDITDGGKVSNGVGIISFSFGVVGRVTVEGTGSTWTNTGSLNVGSAVGDATLNIRQGGQVSSASGVIDNGASGGTAVVNIDGAGAAWTTGELRIAQSGGTGTLNITNGGHLSSSEGMIGYSGIGIGIVTVDGAGSAWINTGNLAVGNETATRGTLTLIAGGLVSAASVNVASVSASEFSTLNIGAAVGDPAAPPGTLDTPILTLNSRGLLIFNHDDANHVFAPPIGGTGAIEHYANKTILTSNNQAGSVQVHGGTLQLDGSLTADVVRVDNGATLAGGVSGTTTVNPGAFTLYGTLDIAGGAPAGTAAGNFSVFNVQTPAGGGSMDMTGGTLKFNTCLNDAASQLTDVLVLDGNNDSIPVAGTATIVINGVGGAGCQGGQITGDGILLIRAQNGVTTTPATFALGGPVTAGNFTYTLYQNTDGNWYLKNELTPRTGGGAATPVPGLSPMGILLLTLLLLSAGTVALRSHRKN